MPIHDWTRGSDAAFHSFQLDWAIGLATALNRGLLPRRCYALNETLELRPEAKLNEIPEPDGPYVHKRWEDKLLDAYDAPPRAAFRASDDRRQYACPIVTIRDDLHQPAAVVLFVTRQDKTTPYRLDRVVEFAVGALTRGLGLLVIDLFPPSKRDPHGVHGLIWDRITDHDFELPKGKPLTLAAYAVGDTITAYVEPVAVGDVLPEMPVFLTPDRYVRCPLEATYLESWAEFPEPLRAALLDPPE